MKRTILSFLLVLAVVVSAAAQSLKLPTVLSDGMVLQQNETINIWGWAKPSAKISVKAGWSGEEIKTKADAKGNWTVSFTTPAGSYEAYQIHVSDGKSNIVLNDILIGEVWLCSGQSNMAWKVEQTLDLAEEMKNASELGKGLRLYSTGRISAEDPQYDVPEAKWQICDPETVAGFSAVGYGFGLEIQEALDVPVGLIQAAYGGTLLEGWVSPDAINNGEKASALQRSVGMINKGSGKWAEKESHLWNANICPLLNVRIAGVIWYQGCSNVKVNPVSYKETLAGLIASWRAEFKNPEMPFYIAQIAPHTYEDLQGAQLRESQAYVAARVPGCALVVTNDSQEIPGDIHPRLKKNVCHRFAQCALGHHYKKDVGEWRSPAYAKREVKGSEMVVSFKNLPTTLKVKGDKIIGFQLGEKVSEESVRYVLADARLDETGTCIILSSDQITRPSDVRYCFDESVGNVFSAEGLPLAPFRTDRNNRPIAESARAYIEPAARTAIAFEGKGYTKARLEEGACLWTNSEMALFEGSFPEEFAGMEILIAEGVEKGGESLGGTIIPKEDGRIYYISRMDKAARRTWHRKQAWRVIIPSEIQVRREIGKNPDGSPKYKTMGSMFISWTDAKAGQKIELQTTDSWSSVIPLAGSIEYKK